MYKRLFSAVITLVIVLSSSAVIFASPVHPMPPLPTRGTVVGTADADTPPECPDCDYDETEEELP